MKKKLQAIVVALLAVSLMLVLVACDNSTSTGSTPAPDVDDPNAPTYTVTLDPAGGTWSDGSTSTIMVSVKEGKAIDFPSYMPEFEGNTLYGWYQTDGSPWPGARKVTGDITLRAKWSVTVEAEVYKLVLTIDGEPVVMEYENGVYQFTYVSSIYGGYAQRSGKYTVYEDDLLAAMEADDGSVQRVLYLAESNYIDSTGTIYAEFYNDGEFELYYDFTNAGERTKYPMNVGYWTYEGYTAPFENTPIPEAGQMGYDSAHVGWDASLIGGETGGGEEPPEDTTPGAEIPEPDEVIFTADATESETMKANFSANGVMAIYMTSYDTNVDAKYLWSAGEDGLVITYDGSEDNIAVDNGDGTYTFADNYGNSYIVSLADLLATGYSGVKTLEPGEVIYTADATESETMKANFSSNGVMAIYMTTYDTNIDAKYLWSAGEDGLVITYDGAGDNIAVDNGDGTYSFSDNYGNSYIVSLADLLAAGN